MAKSIPWGRGTGCSILTNRCENWALSNEGISQKYIHFVGYFCNQANVNMCTHTLTGKGYCPLSTYTSSLGYYAHFTDPKIGGPDSNLDYCPIVYRYTNGACSTVRAGNTYEHFGSNSACFDSSVLRSSSTSSPAAHDSNCLEYKCAATNGGNTTLQVRVSSTWYECGNENAVKSYTLNTDVKGYFKCPKDGHRILCTSNSYVGGGTSTNPGTKDCFLFIFCSPASSISFSVGVQLFALLLFFLLLK